MVKDSGTSPDAGPIRLLNLPTPIRVSEDRQRRPVSIQIKGKAVRVASIGEVWEIDEEWWREQRIARRYYRVTTEAGGQFTIFRDLVGGGWYQQNG